MTLDGGEGLHLPVPWFPPPENGAIRADPYEAVRRIQQKCLEQCQAHSQRLVCIGCYYYHRHHLVSCLGSFCRSIGQYADLVPASGPLLLQTLSLERPSPRPSPCSFHSPWGQPSLTELLTHPADSLSCYPRFPFDLYVASVGFPRSRPLDRGSGASCSCEGWSQEAH